MLMVWLRVRVRRFEIRVQQRERSRGELRIGVCLSVRERCRSSSQLEEGGAHMRASRGAIGEVAVSSDWPCAWLAVVREVVRWSSVRRVCLAISLLLLLLSGERGLLAKLLAVALLLLLRALGVLLRAVDQGALGAVVREGNHRH